MTYPPQQGPNDPYGQQGGGHPQSGGFGQPHPGGYQQQPGGYQQQPGGYPQQPGYQQQPGGYQQFPQTGPTPYGGMGAYGQPPRKRGPLPWILAGGGVVVIAVVVVLIIVLTGGDGAGDSPKGTADAVAAALNNKDVNAFNALVCDDGDKIDPNDVGDDDLDEVTNVRVKSVSEPKGDTATAVLTASYKGKDDDETIPLRKEDGKWCVGSDESSTSGADSATPSTTG